MSREVSDLESWLAGQVDSERLWFRHMSMAEFGARGDGGVNRQALTGEDIAARRQLVSWSEEVGYTCSIDPIGNLFVRRDGRDPSLPPVLVGSHLDSQPAGGKFDGVFGVLAGLESLQAMDAAGIETERAIEVVAWTNEEGSRFAPGMAGSTAFAHQVDLEMVMSACDSEGACFAAELANVLAAFDDLPRRGLGFPVGAYVEAHIEQGPLLEHTGHRIGIVSGIQGARWFTVKVAGEAAHAGTTPMALRRDAFRTTTTIAAALEDLVRSSDKSLRCTIGRVVVQPNSPNTIPGAVDFTIDVRHPDAAVLAGVSDQIGAICEARAGRCRVVVEETLNMLPIEFAPRVVSAISSATSSLGISNITMMSGAFHDACALSSLCPTGMIFIPCAKGISHNPKESVTPLALADGARVLTLAAERLAQSRVLD